ncbi:MAG: SDR family NAD(P)-dependent oxidoreductase, partial [Brevundimonas sp.]
MARDAGMNVAATSRSPEGRAALQAQGLVAIDPADEAQMASAARNAPAVLITVQPDAHGCPGLRAVIPALSRAGAWPDWIGYVSSTAVYGDRDGGWAFEDDALNAATVEGARRVKAETGWLDIGRGMGLTVQLFRLSALYGPGRSVVDRLR